MAMKEINLGRVLTENRRRRGMTQDQLAEHLGVSKAAVSKWETGASYPDIFMLPKLASFFDISIDALMGYEPQMEKAEIRQWYERTAGEFSTLPFDVPLKHCRETARKYYSCYPLLFQVGALLVNHCTMAGTARASEQVLEEAQALFLRVKEGTGDPSLAKEAQQMAAYCLLALNRPAEVFDLLDEDRMGIGPAETLLSSAHKRMGNTSEAKRILQVGIYREMLSLCGLLSSYIGLTQDDPAGFEGASARLQALSDAFHLETLHPGILLTCYIDLAQAWAARGEPERALEILERYTRLATGDIYPLRLHGDGFFTLLEGWIERALPLGDHPPREESVIRRSMTQALSENPAFSALREDPRFQGMVARLRHNEEDT